MTAGEFLILHSSSKHKPYLIVDEPPSAAAAAPKATSPSGDLADPEEEDTPSAAAIEEKKLEKRLEQQPVEKQWNLLGPYLGQYIVYTSANSAWLL